MTEVTFEVNGERAVSPTSADRITEFPYVKIKLDFNTTIYPEQISGGLENEILK